MRSRGHDASCVPGAMTGAPLTPELRAAYEANLWKFYVFRFLVNFQVWLPIWVVYLTNKRELTLTQITALDAAFWVTMVVLEVPTGAVADRWGRRVSLTWGALAYTVALVAFGFGSNYPILLVSYLAWAAAWTLFSGADSAFFYDTVKALGRETEYQKLYGRAWAIQSVGVLLGVIVGAPLAAATDLHIPVLVAAVLMGGAWLMTLTFQEPPRYHTADEQLGYIAGTREAFRIAWRKAPVRYMIGLAAVTVAMSTCLSILTQPFLAHHGVEIGRFGWFLLPGNILGILGALLAYRVTRAIGTNRMVAVLPLIVLTVSMGLGTFDTLLAFAFYPMNGLIWAISFPLISDYLNQRIPSAQRATILSLHSLLFSLMLAPLEPLLGAVADEAGLMTAYRMVAILITVGAAPMLVFWLRAVRREQREAV